jgi:protein dithiol oxidoreductase (disulfide-forming)
MPRIRLLATLAAIVLTPALLAPPAAAEFREGEHYQRLPVPVETRNPDKVEVVEVFSYACIHCKNFEGEAEAWRAQAPDYVDYQRLPATFNDTWKALAQGYYTAEALGVTEQVHRPIFSAIHERGQNVADPERMAEVFAAEAGIAAEQFHQTFRSFGVRSRVQQADARGRAYRLTGTPAMIVDGMYRVDARGAGSNAGMLEVVDYLVAQRRTAAEAAGRGDDAETRRVVGRQ